jgi:hypothetical protein
MALTLTNSFKAGDAIVMSQWDTNFNEIEAEINAFPTNGAIGTGVVHEIDIAQAAVTAAKIEDNIQFVTMPKCKTVALADLDSSFNNDDQLVSMLFALTKKSAVFSDGDFTSGEYLFDEDTTSISEKVTLPNGRVLVFGYKKLTTAITVSVNGSGNKSDTLDLTAHGLTAVYVAFPIVHGSKGIYGQVSELTCTMTALTTTALTVYLNARSIASGGVWGYFYMVIGK